MEEVRNATENASRELSTRFDFRGIDASFEYKDKTVVMKAEAEFQLQQMESMFRTAMSKRNVDTSSMDVKPYDAHGRTYRQTITFKVVVNDDYIQLGQTFSWYKGVLDNALQAFKGLSKKQSAFIIMLLVYSRIQAQDSLSLPIPFFAFWFPHSFDVSIFRANWL